MELLLLIYSSYRIPTLSNQYQYQFLALFLNLILHTSTASEGYFNNSYPETFHVAFFGYLVFEIIHGMPLLIITLSG